MKVLFLDESGDHNLAVIDPQYPLFVLGGAIMDKDYAEGELTAQLNRFKEDLKIQGEGLVRSAGFQTCCIADFQIGRPSARRTRPLLRTTRRLRNLRHGRLGSLRYGAGGLFGLGDWPVRLGRITRMQAGMPAP